MKKIKKYRAHYKQKILLLLLGGLALSLTRSPRTYYRILKMIPKELRALDRMYLYRAIREFERDKLISYHEDENGYIRIVLTERGKEHALVYHIEHMGLRIPKQWDGRWRLVLFDVPEKKRVARDALRIKLKELGFKELQHSIHIVPYPCKDEVNFLVEFFDIRPWVYYVEADVLSNEARWIHTFKLQ